jgi:flagellar motility protein MotE (MotC chaperone)
LIEENAMNVTIRSLLVIAIVTALGFVAFPTKAQAQATGFQDAGAKIRGDTYWPSRASGRYIESARNYAQEVQTYVTKAPQPEPSVVKDIKTDLGRYLDDAQKHLVTMKKDFANDKETVAAVEGLEKELATAIAHNKEMITCCEDQKFDKIKTMTCCTDLVKSLDKVHADHVMLMRKLSQKYGAPGTAK